MKYKFWIIFLGSLAAIGSAGGESLERVDYYISNVTVIDGSGRPPFVVNVTISKGRIAAIRDSSPVQDLAETHVDGTGKFLIPGLWDMHIHVAAQEAHPEALQMLVDSGVTTIRDAGGHLDVLQKWKIEIDSGKRIGPNILMVGPILNGESYGTFQTKVTTPQRGSELVRSLAQQGVNGIKVHRATTPEVLTAITETAHELGLRVSGHIPLGSPPELACTASMDAVDHLGSFLEAWVSIAEKEKANMEGSIQFMLSDEADTLYRCLAKKRIAVTPTLVIYPYIAKSKATPEMLELGRKTVEAMQRIMTRFREAEIPVMAGTDAPLMETGMVFGSSLIEELELLAGAGYSNAELIEIATANPARFMEVFDVTGSIEPGKRADLVLLEKNPLEDISHLREVSAVFVNGRRVK